MVRLFAPDTKCDVSDKIWFRFTVDQPCSVMLRVFSETGSIVRELNCGFVPPGDYTARGKAVLWDRLDSGGTRVAGGSGYFVVIYSNNVARQTERFVLR